MHTRGLSAALAGRSPRRCLAVIARILAHQTPRGPAPSMVPGVAHHCRHWDALEARFSNSLCSAHTAVIR